MRKLFSMSFVLAMVFVALTVFAGIAHAEVNAESTVVVVNTGSEASKKVAQAYVALRSIPQANVVELANVPDQETIDVNQFRDLILKPLLAELDKRNLRKTIHCVAYSSDFPTAIDVRPDAKGKRLPKVLTPTASINSLTFLYQRVLAKDVGYLSLQSNRYYRPMKGRRIAQSDVEKPKTLVPADALRLITALKKARDEKAWAPAEELLRELLNKYPDQAGLHYNLACMLARLEKPEEALASLKHSIEKGLFDYTLLEREADLKSLRQLDEYLALITELKAISLNVDDSLSFNSSFKFAANYSVNADKGESYLLSTVLGVTRGRGNTVDEVIANLTRSVKADGTRPTGTIYLMTNSNVRSTTRHRLFKSVATTLKKLGVKAEVVKGTIPIKKSDVAGAVIGTASFDWKKSESQILPGAICEHLTSYGGVLRKNAGQTPLTDLIRHGAAGASGTVAEPYAIAAKFPSPFIHVHYFRGASMVEAFYQSVSGPYQLLIVGDPLCRPWSKTAGADSSDGK